MLIVSSDTIPGYRIERVLGLVKGSSIRAKHVGKDLVASLRHFVGGEIREYTQMMNEAREQAIERMIEQAQAQDADAIVCTRFTTSMVLQGVAEVLAYGTAVTLQKEQL